MMKYLILFLSIEFLGSFTAYANTPLQPDPDTAEIIDQLNRFIMPKPQTHSGGSHYFIGRTGKRECLVTLILYRATEHTPNSVEANISYPSEPNESSFYMTLPDRRARLSVIRQLNGKYWLSNQYPEGRKITALFRLEKQNSTVSSLSEFGIDRGDRVAVCYNLEFLYADFNEEVARKLAEQSLLGCVSPEAVARTMPLYRSGNCTPIKKDEVVCESYFKGSTVLVSNFKLVNGRPTDLLKVNKDVWLCRE